MRFSAFIFKDNQVVEKVAILPQIKFSKISGFFMPMSG